MTSVTNGAGLTSVSLGLWKQLKKTGAKAVFFKPIADNNSPQNDASTRLAGLTGAPIKLDYAQKMASQGMMDNLMEEVVATFEKLATDADVMIVEGITPDSNEPFLFEINVAVARTLDAEVIVVAADEGTPESLETKIQYAASYYGLGSESRVVGAVLNRVKTPGLKEKMGLFAKGPFKLLGQIPYQSEVGGAAVSSATVQFVAEHFDHAWFGESLASARVFRQTPAVFRHRLIAKSRSLKKKIVLPEGDEPRTIKAAIICHEKKIAHCILVGDPAQIEAVAKAQGMSIPKDVEILDPAKARERYVGPMVELRKGKGLTPQAAAEDLKDNVVLGTMMLALDDVDGLVSGAVHTTANTIKPAFQLIKTAAGCNVVSSIFFMCLPDQVVVYGDCAVLPNPTPGELADIAIQSAESARAFDIPPRVALISYSTGSSGQGPDVDAVKQAAESAKTKRPDLFIEGPMQYDAASVESVGRSKAPGSNVAGRATVFVFPDLNTGNTTYKAVQRSANVISIGPMLQGLRKPVNDLSRGALVEDIVYTIALTAIQAEQVQNAKKV